MDSIDYKNLYQLQDRVLDEVFKTEEIFYLTGGTCLSRFYHQKRYSDDLDFFTSDNTFFYKAIKNIKIALSSKFKLQEEVNSKDFIRFKIEDILQVDFINDRVYRYGDSKLLKNGYYIDNIENILANKLTAVIGRDNPKDIFDIYLIDKFYDIDYSKILSIAHKKAVFDNNELIIRLKTFPKRLLHSIFLIDKNFLDDFDENFSKIINSLELNI